MKTETFFQRHALSQNHRKVPFMPQTVTSNGKFPLRREVLSVVATLREMLELWWRNIRWITVVSLTVGIPQILITDWALNQYPPAGNLKQTDLAWSGFLLIFSSLALTIVLVIADALSSAGVLGVLIAQSSGMKSWNSIKDCVRTYTWTLLRVVMILTFIGIIFFAIFQTIYIIFVLPLSPKSIPVFGALRGALFLIFLKYALADPLVVIEGRGALDALAQSWRMTRGHFWYVLGCYFFLWLGIWLVHWPFRQLEHRIIVIDFPVQLLGVWLDSLWVVIAWVMYFQIKAADEPPVANSEGAGEADP
jgi:hypothetical protein